MRMKKYVLKTALLLILLLIGFAPDTVYADKAPYTSLTIDKDGYFVRTVDGYIPKSLVDTFGDLTLKNPSDLFISEDGTIYIADTGNKRVIACDRSFTPILVIDEGLKGPTGVYVDQKKQIYIADPKLKKIVVYSPAGELLREYDSPVSPLFGADSKYAPSKLAVNSSGTIFALSEGNANGILNISAEDDFYGYFGANNTKISWSNILKRLVFTEDQQKQLQKNVPASAINIDMDETGLVYTVTQGTGEKGIKKYNMAGNNMLDNTYADELVTDIAVGNIENMFTVSNQGYIYEYTRDGELLFYFGGNDDGKNRTGLFVNAVAIDADADGYLYVLDGERSDITVFQQTQYAVTVHEALKLYQDGLYLESQEPWEKVLGQNSLFDYAYRGIGQAYYKLEDYQGAMQAARYGGDKSVYSNAFWEIRNVWLRDNILKAAFLLLILYLLRRIWIVFGDRIIGIRRIKKGVAKLTGRKLCRELAYVSYMPKNPADAFYGIKFEKKASVLSSTLLYIAVFLIYLANKYYSGFLFKTVADGQYELGQDMIVVFGMLAIFVICNNLICSIRDGEGSFQNIYCSFAYCFMPYIIFKPVVILLSHVITYNEQFIIILMNDLIVAGTILLIVLMIKEIQAYTLKETFRSIFLTLFTIVVLLAMAMIMFALIRQVSDFIIEIVKEGYYRGR